MKKKNTRLFPYFCIASDAQAGKDLGLRLVMVDIVLSILIARDVCFANFPALCKSKAILSSYTSLVILQPVAKTYSCKE